MKKIAILLVMVAGMLSFTSASAQKWTDIPRFSGDSLNTNATIDSVHIVIPATAGYSTAMYKVKMTKGGGTIATLKAYLYKGDGTDYVVADSSAVFTDVTSNVAYFEIKNGVPSDRYWLVVKPVGTAGPTCAGVVRFSYLYKGFKTQ